MPPEHTRVCSDDINDPAPQNFSEKIAGGLNKGRPAIVSGNVGAHPRALWRSP